MVRTRSSSLQSVFAEGLKRHKAGQLSEAAELYRLVLAVRPRHADSLHMLGVVAHQTGQPDRAAAMIAEAIDIEGRTASYHCNLGAALVALGRTEEAAGSYRRALALRPDFPEAHYNLGNLLKEQGRLDEADACYRAALSGRPAYAEAEYALGLLRRAQERSDEAVACFDRALAINPDYAEAHNIVGTTRRERRRLDEAVACYRRAIALKPDFAEAHTNLAMALLAQGEMAAGWEEYEWRWKLPHTMEAAGRFAAPRWRGEDAAGRTLLVHAEQGFGDTLQFCRYVPLVAAAGLRVIVEAPEPLVRLLGCLPKVERVVAKGAPLPPFDLHCPMLSLPLAMLRRLPTIPSAETYLRADEALVAGWRARLAAMPGRGLRVGLVWAGNPRRHVPNAAATDRKRSVPPERLAPLFEVPDVRFFSLQKGGPPAPAWFGLTDFMGEMADFADTAALIANLDLVISVDTAVAHLAAALGKPVWVLDRFDPCWRWLTGRRDSPWYPGLRLYRQSRPGEWGEVLAEVVRDLRSLVSAGHTGSAAPGGEKAVRPVGQMLADALADHRAGRLQQAEAAYRRILAADPRHADSLHLLGVVRHQLGQSDSAVALIGQAIAINPEAVAYHANLAAVLRPLGREAEVIACLRRVVALQPGRPEALNELGRALRIGGQVDEAIGWYRRALDLRGDLPGVHNNLGVALADRMRLAEAACSYDRALALKPDFAEAHVNRAIVRLTQGDLAGGWEDYEWRLRAADNPAAGRRFGPQRWRGEEATGRTVLIHAEQGFGDTLQFCRYAGLAAARGLRVVLEVPAPLVRLLRGVKGVVSVVAQGAAVPAFDLHCPMLSLPLAMGTRLETIPAGAGYLRADPGQSAAWRQRLDSMGARRPRVGVVWAGGARAASHLSAIDRRRSIAPERLAALFDVGGVDFFSLQKERPAAPEGFRLIDFMDEMADFADTAALVENLDLVIAVDTAVAHLAAGLGKPVWLLNRFDTCWRWLTERRDSPWYPTMRLYRQERFGDWDAVVARVAEDLRALAGASGAVGQQTTGAAVPAMMAETVRHHRAGRLEDAAAPGPDNPDALRNQALLWRQRGRPDEAIEGLRGVLARAPGRADIHNELGNLLKAQGRLEEAVACFRRALALMPALPGLHNNLGNVLLAQERWGEAEECYRRALALRPESPDARNNLGIAAKEQGRQEEAEACFRAALALRPDFADAHNNLAIVLNDQGRTEEALACYRRVAALRPDRAAAHNNLGRTLLGLGRTAEAVACYRLARALDPLDADAQNNLGVALGEQRLLDEAVVSLRQAIALRPDFADAHGNLGIALHQQRLLHEAVACYRRALALKPQCPETHLNLGLALLALGDMKAGWEEYEWRWLAAEAIKDRRNFAQPQWRGEAAGGRTLLVHAEQGFGDTVQFCRYAPQASAAGFRVILEAPGPLVRLLRGLPGVHQVVARGERLPAFDVHCPLLSMPLAMRTTLDSIPGSVSYLRADDVQAASWAARLAALPGDLLRVGLVWAGGARPQVRQQAAMDRRRSLEAARLAPLFDVKGVRFFSLQKDGPAICGDLPLHDFMAEMADFADTAALIANLDLVIAVDTAVVHLAAALGKPVWLLDRFDSCWRWLTERRDSPWYPTLHLYRQPHPGDWESVLSRVACDLRTLAGRPG